MTRQILPLTIAHTQPFCTRRRLLDYHQLLVGCIMHAFFILVCCELCSHPFSCHFGNFCSRMLHYIDSSSIHNGCASVWLLHFVPETGIQCHVYVSICECELLCAGSCYACGYSLSHKLQKSGKGKRGGR